MLVTYVIEMVKMNFEIDKDSHKRLDALCIDMEYKQKELIPILIKEGIKIVEAKLNGKTKSKKTEE